MTLTALLFSVTSNQKNYCFPVTTPLPLLTIKCGVTIITVTEAVFIRVGSLSDIVPAQFFSTGVCVCVCVFGGEAGHKTADDWCVCERGVSENVMIGLRHYHFNLIFFNACCLVSLKPAMTSEEETYVRPGFSMPEDFLQDV